jgi:hypothetical protein
MSLGRVPYFVLLLKQVNRIRELPQKRQIVATHTDGPEVCTVECYRKHDIDLFFESY